MASVASCVLFKSLVTINVYLVVDDVTLRIYRNDSNTIYQKWLAPRVSTSPQTLNYNGKCFHPPPPLHRARIRGAHPIHREGPLLPALILCANQPMRAGSDQIRLQAMAPHTCKAGGTARRGPPESLSSRIRSAPGPAFLFRRNKHGSNRSPSPSPRSEKNGFYPWRWRSACGAGGSRFRPRIGGLLQLFYSRLRVSNFQDWGTSRRRTARSHAAKGGLSAAAYPAETRRGVPKYRRCVLN